MKTPKHITDIKITKTYCMKLKGDYGGLTDEYDSDIFFDKYTTDMGLPNWDVLFEAKFSRVKSGKTTTTIYITGIYSDFKIFETDKRLKRDEIREKIYELMDDEENLLFLNQNHPHFHFTYYKKK